MPNSPITTMPDSMNMGTNSVNDMGASHTSPSHHPKKGMSRSMWTIIGLASFLILAAGGLIASSAQYFFGAQSPGAGENTQAALGFSCTLAMNTYACNSPCMADAECQTSLGNDYSCATIIGSGVKFCRLTANPGSASCTPGATPTPTPAVYSCGSLCTSDAQCQTANPGYICFPVGDTRVCRLASNPGSQTCLAPTPTPTQTPQPTPTPTPISSSCTVCDYQADAFWGPVITSFVGPKRYSYPAPPSRLIGGGSNKNDSSPQCNLVAVGPQPYNWTPPISPCHNPVERGLLRTTIDKTNAAANKGGYIKFTITNTSTTCSFPVGAATYRAQWTGTGSITNAEIDPQNLYDSKATTLLPNRSVVLYVRTPMLENNPNNNSSCHALPN